MAKLKIKKIGRVTSQSVEKCTGKNWDQWIEILDNAGARNWPHKEIVALLVKKYKLSLWWQQMVTSQYEVYIGRRVQGQNLKGEYSTVATKTFPTSQKAFWKLFSSKAGLALWLKPMSEFKLKPGESFEVYGGVFGEVRTMKAPTRVRLSWQESDWEKPSIVQVMIIGRKKDQTMVAIQHDNLKSESIKTKMLGYWKSVLNDLLASV